MSLTTKTETITPAKAAEYLKKNRHNRRIQDTLVSKYAREIKEGLWECNGETIVFDSKGRLTDGQHRLLGVVEAEHPITTLVVRGAPVDSFKTMDSGKRRTPLDVLHLDGFALARVLTPALTQMFKFEQGRIGMTRMPKGGSPTNLEYCQIAERYPALKESVEFVSKLGVKGVVISPGHMAFIHFLLAQKSRTAANYYTRQILAGTDVKARTPQYFVRQRLEQANIQKQYRLTATERIAIIINGWNMWRTKPMKKIDSAQAIRFRTRGKIKDQFPAVL